MKAFQIIQVGLTKESFEVSSEVPLPSVGEDQLLVKVVSAALNPFDWKRAAWGFILPPLPGILGSDVSGIVESVGSKVTKFKKGDQIFGYIPLGLPGPYAEYCLIPEIFASQKPQGMGFEEASSFGMGSLTAAVGLYQHLGFVVPSKSQPSQASGDYLLICGGSGSVGSYAVQLAKLSGLKVIATCSPANFEYVKSLGAAHVFDYASPTVASDIKSLTKGGLKFSLDCIGTNESMKMIFESLSSTVPAKVASVMVGFKGEAPSNVTVIEFILSAHDRDYFSEIATLVGEKKLLPNRVEKLPNGLAGIFDGFLRLQRNNVSGAKLVVNVAETP